jgi:1-acyl-sn-glycerol-3-phosphate acyltransferase
MYYKVKKYIMILHIHTMYIIFYLYLAVLVNGLCKTHDTVNKLFNTFIILLSPIINIHSDETSNIPDRVLLLSNHVSLLDYISLHKVLIDVYPDHLPVFVSIDKVKSIPYYGGIFSRYYILINRKNTAIDDIIRKCTELNKKKVVIVLFPEGDIYRDKNIIKSQEYCIQNNIDRFDNVLCPKTKAYNIILKYFKPDLIKLSSLQYYMPTRAFIKYIDFINVFKKYPKCDVHLTSCNKETPLMDIWRRLDTSLWRSYIKNKN